MGATIVLALACAVGDHSLTRQRDGDVAAPDTEAAEDAGTSFDPMDVPGPDPRDMGGDTPPEWAVHDGEEVGDFLYADGVVHEFDVDLDADALAALAASPSEYVPATFHWGGESWDVGLRLKGTSSFRPLPEKASMKIDFSWPEPEARFHGVEHLTLNNMIQDRTMLREHAYYHYAAMRGVPAARHGFARVRVNGELYGLYGIVETMDEHFVHRAFQLDDEGPLYEGSGCDLTYARDWYELEEAGLAGDVDDLVATVESTDAGAFFSMLNAEFDVDSLFTYWAMDLASGNDDGYARNHHNYLLYYGPTAHRWWMIPWGTDRSFEDHVSVHGVSTDLMGVLVTRCLDDAACAGQLDARILDVAEGWADSGLEAWVEDAIPVILDDCEADPKAELPCDPWSLPSYMDRRVGEVEGELAP